MTVYATLESESGTEDNGSDCVAAVQAWQAASSAAASTKRPVDEGAVSHNTNEVLMLRSKLKTLEEHTVITNKSVLEAEKERDCCDISE